MSSSPQHDEPWSEDSEDPLARPPHALERFSNRGSADMMRHVLAEEGVPAVVERDHQVGGWAILVAESAVEDARRALENRAALAGTIDWDDFDPGEMSARDARMLAAAPGRRRLARRLLFLATLAVLGMVVFGLLTMILDLLPSEGPNDAIVGDGSSEAVKETRNER
ncbi:MAG: hypothetical protein GY895_15625 [Phycisphaera sp.]|nr:hypothetical protein [Phycisphaera sp.]